MCNDDSKYTDTTISLPLYRDFRQLNRCLQVAVNIRQTAHIDETKNTSINNKFNKITKFPVTKIITIQVKTFLFYFAFLSMHAGSKACKDKLNKKKPGDIH